MDNKDKRKGFAGPIWATAGLLGVILYAQTSALGIPKGSHVSYGKGNQSYITSPNGQDNSRQKLMNIEEAVQNNDMEDSVLNGDMKKYAQYISEFEGRRRRVYDPNIKDRKPEPTIGVGHFMGRGDSREVFREVIPEVNYDNVLRGKEDLTDNQIDTLFAYDLPRYVERAKKLVSNFDNLPLYIRQAIVDMSYRGDLGDSPKTRALINRGDFEGAAIESINRQDYRDAEGNGMKGIRKRLDARKSAFLKYDRELKQKD